jgi:hypothetical protein
MIRRLRHSLKDGKTSTRKETNGEPMERETKKNLVKWYV